MSLEARVESLESHFDSLDSAVRSLVKITGETHQIILENQRENRLLFQQIELRLSQQDHVIATNQRENLDRFKQIDDRFDQLELLIRQLLPNSTN